MPLANFPSSAEVDFWQFLQVFLLLLFRSGFGGVFHFSLACIGEGNGNPLQCSCLENPRDQGAWWAPVYGVAQSWTRLKWLSSSIHTKISSRELKDKPWNARRFSKSIHLKSTYVQNIYNVLHKNEKMHIAQFLNGSKIWVDILWKRISKRPQA